MSMDVSILLIGDVILYLKDNLWNIVFITDADHTANVSVFGSSSTPYPLRPSTTLRMISLTTNDPNVGVPSYGQDYLNILNMHERQLHYAPAGTNNLVVSHKPAAGREAIHMTMPFGVAAGERPFCQYWIADAAPSSPQNLRPLPAASAVSINFSIGAGCEFDMRVNDLTAGTPFPAWKAVDGTKLTLVFDNNCHGGSGSNKDFLRYYDWIQDKRGPGHQFIAGKVDPKCGTAFERSELSEFLDHIMSGPLGNCDPVDIIPPPGP